MYINGTVITGPVFTYDSSYVVSTLAGISGKSGFADGIGTAASFHGPSDAVTDANGNIYIADSYNNAIRKITPNGVVTTFAGGVGAGADDGTGIGPFFNNLTGIAIDAAGTLYVTDAGNNRVRKVTQAGVVTTLAGSTYGDVDGTGTAAKFGWLQGIGVDKNGNVLVVDNGNCKIKKITPAGVVTTLAGNSIPGGKDGVGASASFCLPAGLAIDGNDNVYVAEGKFTFTTVGGTYQGNNKIRKITPDGTVSTFAGSGTVGGTNGTGTGASFDNPNGLRFDSNGNLYVTETYGQRIRKITPGGVVTTLAGTGFFGATNGTVDIATFYGPSGIGIDNKGNCYVADFTNALIRKISMQ
ncbi:hypothetical protein A4H97_17925 [Niastella yeongjuensis]|uniref:SMP-30/Gluconolactonase/LRE-like region domain-containing protein n=1 Tax=Niastella yeongjuensis TaxID=354355 RepID=A0A1V9DYE8_9BACT|nr:hypothetical protein A4H97_17925 [Niastella yeongjuensis]